MCVEDQRQVLAYTTPSGLLILNNMEILVQPQLCEHEYNHLVGSTR